MYGIIYLAIHTETGRKYVGQTIKPLRIRMREHMTAKSSRFGNVLRKYGREAFSISVIDSASSKDELNTKEKQWIATHGCIAPAGFNLTPGGSGGRPTEETILKLRKNAGRHPLNITGEQVAILRHNPARYSWPAIAKQLGIGRKTAITRYNRFVRQDNFNSFIAELPKWSDSPEYRRQWQTLVDQAASR
jgi:hypothetical protein